MTSSAPHRSPSRAAVAAIEVRVSRAGTIGAVRLIAVRRDKAPTVTVRCLPPGAKKPARC